MKALSLMFVIMLFSIGHSYAEELEKAPHEAVVITEYEKLMSGEVALDVTNPTDEYGQFVNDARVLDQVRVSGKIIGRSPAVIDETAFDEFRKNVKVKQK